jgi:prepilin-type N-terminal cleavage/methylation domain-containing protein
MFPSCRTIFSKCATRRERVSGFSLVELLVVIAILSILVTLTTPAIQSILGAKGIGRGLNDVASILELARTEAMARRTYVYVGFENTTDASGNAELRIAAAESPDGSGATTTGLLPVSKMVRLENLRLTNYSGLPQAVRDAATNASNNASYVSGMTVAGITFTNGQQVFDGNMLVISPEGEILPSADSPVFRERAHVGLVGMKGATPMTNDGGLVTFDGGAGAITITRP